MLAGQSAFQGHVTAGAALGLRSGPPACAILAFCRKRPRALFAEKARVDVFAAVGAVHGRTPGSAKRGTKQSRNWPVVRSRWRRMPNTSWMKLPLSAASNS